ncbi:MAG: hypothetical protein GX051_06365 [Clostridiales bacterium]|nr:hypothetical protein [Clostridiales bacterium]
MSKRKEKTEKKSTRAGRRDIRAEKAKIFIFCAVMLAGAVVSFIMPLRPEYSESEKRKLAVFPAFSTHALFEGTYFDDINTWFSDTFPFREHFMQLNGKLEKVWGIRRVAIHGEVDNGDEIPDVPLIEEPSSSDVPPSSMPGEQITTTETVPDFTTDAPSVSQTTPSQSDEVKTQTLGAVLIVGDSGYEYYNFNQTAATSYINTVRRAASLLEGKANLYLLLTPTSIDITLADSVRSTVKSSDQKKAINYFYSSVPSSVKTVPVYDTLRAHRSEPVFFRTDHHWTALGAYYAYREFAAVKGVTPDEIGRFKTKTFGGFLGSFYSDTLNEGLAKNPDTVTAYVPYSNAKLVFYDTKGAATNWPIINNVENYKSHSKYSTFVAGDQPFEIITNSDLKDGSSCLVIKESFGNAMIPFLIGHYQTVYVVDPRYYTANTLTGLVSQKGIKDVLIIDNISATRSRVYTAAIDKFVR